MIFKATSILGNLQILTVAFFVRWTIVSDEFNCFLMGFLMFPPNKKYGHPETRRSLSTLRQTTGSNYLKQNLCILGGWKGTFVFQCFLKFHRHQHHLRINGQEATVMPCACLSVVQHRLLERFLHCSSGEVPGVGLDPASLGSSSAAQNETHPTIKPSVDVLLIIDSSFQHSSWMNPQTVVQRLKQISATRFTKALRGTWKRGWTCHQRSRRRRIHWSAWRPTSSSAPGSFGGIFCPRMGVPWGIRKMVGVWWKIPSRNGG